MCESIMSLLVVRVHQLQVLGFALQYPVLLGRGACKRVYKGAVFEHHRQLQPSELSLQVDGHHILVHAINECCATCCCATVSVLYSF
jgi:hypothetical protein